MKTDSYSYGKLPLSDEKYKTIEWATDTLKECGFMLNHIYTYGETSGHMWTIGFDKEYETLNDFYANAMSDYEQMSSNATKGGGPCVEWERTGFGFTNDSNTVKITISIYGEPVETKQTHATVCFMHEEKDREYITMLKQKLALSEDEDDK